MTNDNLQQLLAAIQMSEDGDFLRVLAETTLNRLMDFDADNAAGAARHERSPERATYRNGYRDRVLETRVGALDLKIPKFRSGPSYYPGFILEPRRLMEKALTAVIQEAWINGVSTKHQDQRSRETDRPPWRRPSLRRLPDMRRLTCAAHPPARWRSARQSPALQAHCARSQ
jgi:transposase-like protein